MLTKGPACISCVKWHFRTKSWHKMSQVQQDSIVDLQNDTKRKVHSGRLSAVSLPPLKPHQLDPPSSNRNLEPVSRELAVCLLSISCLFSKRAPPPPTSQPRASFHITTTYATGGISLHVGSTPLFMGPPPTVSYFLLRALNSKVYASYSR